MIPVAGGALAVLAELADGAGAPKVKGASVAAGAASAAAAAAAGAGVAAGFDSVAAVLPNENAVDAGAAELAAAGAPRAGADDAPVPNAGVLAGAPKLKAGGAASLLELGAALDPRRPKVGAEAGVDAAVPAVDAAAVPEGAPKLKPGVLAESAGADGQPLASSRRFRQEGTAFESTI